MKRSQKEFDARFNNRMATFRGGEMKTKTKIVTKKLSKKKAAAAVAAQGQRSWALAQCYAGMRAMGHAPLVASAMLKEIADGFSVAEIDDAVKQYGDV